MKKLFTKIKIWEKNFIHWYRWRIPIQTSDYFIDKISLLSKSLTIISFIINKTFVNVAKKSIESFKIFFIWKSYNRLIFMDENSLYKKWRQLFLWNLDHNSKCWLIILGWMIPEWEVSLYIIYTNKKSLQIGILLLLFLTW